MSEDQAVSAPAVDVAAIRCPAHSRMAGRTARCTEPAGHSGLHNERGFTIWSNVQVSQ